ncbi:serine/threonine-protein phosphatase 6 regulatory ankyrin repeat subunit A-like [Copidosoma floridanum]|uniref:serine/threonine-protein phosphatase 6 regulatory ankyrin repeat subunit A-like n=1 Tax=Copidosoma floridanum TaxID=29053 RepID=UPI0006C97B51|nr:serine/threonine-protein phosphatase 6 regulatory ankyrin repeat subunit A-like [Copidosoma floridanum]
MADYVAHYLIATGCNINSLDHFDNSPLTNAIESNRVSLAKIILQAGAARSNCCYKDGYGPLFLAIKNGHIGMVKMLLKMGFRVSDRNFVNETPLHVAVKLYSGNVRILQALIDAGADVNARNKKGCTPLHFAQNESAMEVLLKNGADVHATSDVGETPLHTIVAGDVNLRALKTLIIAGSNSNCLDNKGRGVIHKSFMTFRHHRQVLKILVDNGASVNTIDHDDLDPLTFGIKQLQIDTRHYDDDDDDHFSDDSNRIPLTTVWMEELIKLGVKVSRRNFNKSPLRFALSYAPYSGLVSFLLSKGATFDFKNRFVLDVLNQEKLRKTSYVLISHAAIFMIKHVNNGPRNFTVKILNDQQRSYYAECIRELNFMKNKKILETNVTLLELFLDKSIARYARDEIMISAIEIELKTTLLPIYGKRLAKRFFDEKEKQSLTSGAFRGLERVLNISRYSCITIFDNINKYLNEDDMVALSKI